MILTIPPKTKYLRTWLREDRRYTYFNGFQAIPRNRTRSLTQFHSKEDHDLSRASMDGWPITWNYGFLLIFFFFLQHVSQHIQEKETDSVIAEYCNFTLILDRQWSSEKKELMAVIRVAGSIREC